MKPEDVAAVGEWLQAQIGVPFVVVGGSAIGAEVPVATKDIDVLISRRDWQKVDSTLEHHSQAAPLEPMSGTIRGTVLVIGDEKIDLEFLSDAPFTGELGPEAFLRHVKEHGSREYHGLL